MTWVIIAITPYLLWSIVAVLDKYVVAHKVKNPSVFWVWQVYLAAFLLLLIPFVGFTIPNPQILFWCFIAGFFYFFAALPYYYAVAIEEVSRLNIMWNLIPFFTVIGSYFFLHERLTSSQLLAFLFLVTGAIVASLHIKSLRGFKLSRAFGLMVASSCMYSISWMALAYIGNRMPFVHAYLWMIIFLVLTSFLVWLSPRFRRDFADDFRTIDRRGIMGVIGTAVFDHSGIFFGVWALSFGFASLFTALEGFQAVFVFLIAVIISLYFPRIFKEELDRKNIILKLIAIVLMGVGVALLSL